MSVTVRLVSVFASVLVLTGCASIDFDYPRPTSSTLEDTNDTYLGRHLVSLKDTKPPGESGFYALADGIDALAIRLLLAERAERSIDVQYYLIKNDVVGKVFIESLLKAADRGVCVHLLLDDIFTTGYDAGISALDAHPNFEIRIFNPFNRGAVGRAFSAVTDFGRINRRMHNKSFTVDNQMTVIGGRNIAGEYFSAREDANFSDLDVLGIGPIVNDVSTMFDTYWNHETALPVPAFINNRDDVESNLDLLRAVLGDASERIGDTKYADAVRRQVYSYVHTDLSIFRWAPYRLVYDSPDKGVKSRAGSAPAITTPLIETLQSAEREVILISPYFVPRRSGVRAIDELRARGVEVTVITNSLAANNQFAVHGGYAPSRKPLLRSGVRIHEVRPDAEVSGTEFIDASGAKATLHTKAFVVDSQTVFIGSFNFDPRSAYINTELGVLIEDPVLARGFTDAIQAGLGMKTYEVFLDDRGRLRWRGDVAGQQAVLDKEPQTTRWQRFLAGLVRLLPIRGQL